MLLALAVLAAACGDDEPETTVEEALAEVEGRELTQTEIDERLAVGATLCRLDDEVLDAVWQRLDDDQLAFQDVVFSFVCPDRATFYAGLTGRYVTEEAENSGVVTSTTRRSTTTTTTATTLSPTLAPRATIGPAPSDDAGDQGSTVTSEGSTLTVVPGPTVEGEGG